MAQLTLTDIRKCYGDNPPAVSDFSLTIEPGQFVALLGPSGCGKTTILRMIAGFEQVSAGQIYHGDQLLSEAGRQVAPEKRGMGMVFQSYALWPHMTVADNVGYPLKVRGVKGRDYRRRVGEALDVVLLTDYADRVPRDLSGGQRQRVALARCLVGEPEVILFDEPLANLDRHLRASMEETFRAFHRRTGATMIYVTHDQGEAMALADRVAVMDRGRLVQYSTPQDLYRTPANEMVARLIGNGTIVAINEAHPATMVDGEVVMKALGTASGGPQKLLVRPEDVRIGEGPLEARIRDCVFKGERYSLSLELGDGTALGCYAGDSLAVGAVTRVRIDRAWALEVG